MMWTSAPIKVFFTEITRASLVADHRAQRARHSCPRCLAAVRHRRPHPDRPGPGLR
ncbi:MAG: hypothetical protein ACLTYW_06415 [Collinsella sp.]